MDQSLVLGQAEMPLFKGICCLLSAERAGELTMVMADEEGRLEAEPLMTTEELMRTIELRRLTRLALHIELHRLDRTTLPIYQGREQLMAGAAALLDEDASLECQDAMRLLALQLDKLLRSGNCSQQFKLDGLTLTALESRALAAQSPNSSSVVRGSWRRKTRNQLGHASWLDVVEAALWCFWHSDDLRSGEVLLGVLLEADFRVYLIYSMLAGAFYFADVTTVSVNY